MEALAQFAPLIFIAVVFWLLIIRPQQARAAKHRALVSSLGSGDRIVTIGGLHGTVVGVDEDTLRLELAPNTVVTVARQAVARRLVDADHADETATGLAEPSGE